MSGSGRAEDVVFRREEGEPRSAATTRGLVGRGAPLVVAMVALAMVPLIAWLMRDDPREAGLRPYGEDVAGLGEAGGGADKAEVGDPGYKGGYTSGNPAKRAVDVLLEAVRTRDFWLLAGSFFVCGVDVLCVIAALIVLPIGKKKSAALAGAAA